MPLYTYTCSCTNEVEELRKVDERHNPIVCPACGDNMQFEVGAPKFDTLHMGTDPAYPTFYKKWGELQRDKNMGKVRDDNNNQIRGGY